MPERVEQERPIGRGRQTKKTYPRHLSRLLRVGSERRGEETHGEDSDECDTPDRHAGTDVASSPPHFDVWRIWQTSRHDRTRSLPMRCFEAGYENICMTALLDLRRRG